MNPDASALASQFDDLLRVASRTSTEGRRIAVADVVMEFGSSDSVLVERFCRPMRHLPQSQGDVDHEVWLVRRSTVTDNVARRWEWQSLHHGNDRFDFSVRPWYGVLVAQDLQRSVTVAVLDDALVPRLDRPDASRPVLESVLSRHGAVGVHGGTVGDGERCVLVTARGGSGKSTLVAHAVRRGHRTTGDDMLYFRPDNGWLYSAFATVKVAPESPASAFVDSALPVVDAKRMGWLPDLATDCMVSRQRPVSIVVPRVGDRVRIEPADEASVLTALLPNSVQLASDKAHSVKVLTDLVRSVPCFALTVAHDADAELAALVEVAPWLAEPVCGS